MWEETEAAAEARWEDPVAFLWRARRVTEALLHALRVKAAPDSLHDPNATIEGLLSDKRVKPQLGAQVARDLRGLQDLGNLGAHIQGEVIDSARSSEIAAAQLVGAVTWFFEKHPVRGVDRDTWEVALLGVRDRARSRPGPLERVRRATDRARQLDTQLDEARRTMEAAPALARHASAPPSLPTRRWLLVGMALTVPSLALGALVGSAVTRGAVRLEPVAPRATVTIADAAVTVLDVPVVAEAPPAPPECPPGTIELSETTVNLLPPLDRPGWPRPAHPGQPQQRNIARVCLERRVAPVSEVLGWRSDLGERFRGCVSHPPGPSEAMPCLNHEDAVGWCARRAGWRLPRLVEWEAISERSERAQLGELEPPMSARESPLEWVEDHFPPEVFDLRPASRQGVFVARGPLVREQHGPTERARLPSYSWNQRDGVTRIHFLFVRCAFDPSSSDPSDAPR